MKPNLFSKKQFFFLAFILGFSIVAQAQTTTFNYTGGAQTYTVPSAVSSLAIDMKGGAGGGAYVSSSSFGPNARGGRVQCNLAVTAGQILYIYVGNVGQNCQNGSPASLAGYNGGGVGGTFAAAGGGASDIRVGGTALTNRVVVAGGAGGGGDFSYTGGSGGDVIGMAGQGGAGGGKQSGPGAGGGTPGAFGTGGAGQSYSGGGGGGGWYGGNGGVSNGGGGGGSSYTDPTLCSDVTHTQGYTAANGAGQITISILCSTPSVGSITGNTAICGDPGTTTTLSTTNAANSLDGVWISSNTAVAVVGSTGVVTAVGSGTATITFRVVRSCGSDSVVVPFSAYQIPVLSGNNTVCAADVSTLTTSVPGGVWTSGNTSVATVSNTGDVTGVAAGTADITYTTGGSCFAVATVTAYPSSPAAIAGATSLCGGASTTLSSADMGGFWFSSDPAVATVDVSTGVVSTLQGGTTTISYSRTAAGTCPATSSFTVYALPANQVLSIDSITCDNIYFGLSGSQTNVLYTLYMNGLEAPGLLSAPSAMGTGGPVEIVMHNIGFLPSVSDVFTVLGTDVNSSCTSFMGNSVTGAAFPLPVSVHVTGGGILCQGDAGFNIGTDTSYLGVQYQLYSVDNNANVGTPLDGINAALDFGVINTQSDYWVVATDTTTKCSLVMQGAAGIHVNPLPPAHNVVGGGTFCVGSGPGFDITLDGSDPGIKYQLYNTTVPVGDAIAGTTAGLDFGYQATTGLYSVMAIDTTLSTMCTTFMTGAANVIANPVPIVHNVTGGGTYCAGSPAFNVGLDNSNSGVRYTLFDGLVQVAGPVDGIDAAIDFGVIPAAGVYAVVATDTTTHCTSNMSGNATVVVNPLPVVYNVLGGGAYCDHGGGVQDSLSGSDLGISYQLYNGAVLAGGPVAGTGNALSLGYVTAAGVYTVVATDDITLCTSNMASSATVAINPLPFAQSVSVGGSFCAGGTGIAVSIGSSETGVNYQLYNGAATVGAAVPGTGAAINFGLKTAAGNYAVVAVNSTTQCTNNMNGISVIAVNPVLVPAVTLSRNRTLPVCAGTSITFNVTPINGGANPAYQWRVNGAIVASSSTAYTYSPLNNDVVTLKLRSDAICVNPDTVVVTDTMHILPVGAPTVVITATSGVNLCQGAVVTFTATPTMGGTAPHINWVKNHIVTDSGTSFSYTPTNDDIIYAVLTSNYMCRTSDEVFSNNITMNVSDPIVPSVFITAHPGQTIKPGMSDTLLATVANGGDAPTYAWYINGTLQAGVTSSTMVKSTFADHDSVSVKVTRGDACGLFTFNSIKLNVNTLGVFEQAASMDITVAPNPNKGEFTVSGSIGLGNSGEATLDLTNMLGQVIYSKTTIVTNGELNEHISMNAVPAGNYLLSIRSGADRKVMHVVITQ